MLAFCSFHRHHQDQGRGVPRIHQLGDMYKDALPSAASLQNELHCWYVNLKSQEQEHGQSSLPNSPSLTLPHVSQSSETSKFCCLFLTPCLSRLVQQRGYSVA